MWRCGSKREKKDDSLGVGVLDEPKVDLSRQWGGSFLSIILSLRCLLEALKMSSSRINGSSI